MPSTVGIASSGNLHNPAREVITPAFTYGVYASQTVG